MKVSSSTRTVATPGGVTEWQTESTEVPSAAPASDHAGIADSFREGDGCF